MILWCWIMHSRFAVWRDNGDLACSRCDRIVWEGAAHSEQYRRMYGDSL